MSLLLVREIRNLVREKVREFYFLWYVETMFVSDLVRNPEDRFSHDMAHNIKVNGALHCEGAFSKTFPFCNQIQNSRFRFTCTLFHLYMYLYQKLQIAMFE